MYTHTHTQICKLTDPSSDAYSKPSGVYSPSHTPRHSLSLSTTRTGADDDIALSKSISTFLGECMCVCVCVCVCVQRESEKEREKHKYNDVFSIVVHTHTYALTHAHTHTHTHTHTCIHPVRNASYVVSFSWSSSLSFCSAHRTEYLQIIHTANNTRTKSTCCK